MIITIKYWEVKSPVGYINSYNFGVFSDDLTNSFKLLYKNDEYSYMFACLTIKDRQTNKDKIYEIALNPRLFIDTY
ncbi:hypothetical protein [Borreliella japonica]|uniref:BB0158 famile outer surface lipoprotein n=1 Tax=Borreliella japonica TaxID=34095 RepID=UPI002649E6B8|nr:hypothetical protein [Borreliella japonica]WKC87624.1 hypothetical protein QIA21_00155 [Borreliella japonica]